MFSCEFCEMFKNTFFYRTPLVAASVVDLIYQLLKHPYSYLVSDWVFFEGAFSLLLSL